MSHDVLILRGRLRDKIYTFLVDENVLFFDSRKWFLLVVGVGQFWILALIRKKKKKEEEEEFLNKRTDDTCNIMLDEIIKENKNRAVHLINRTSILILK